MSGLGVGEGAGEEMLEQGSNAAYRASVNKGITNCVSQQVK